MDWGGDIMAQSKEGKTGAVGKAVASKNSSKGNSSSASKASSNKTTNNKSGKR